MNSIIDFFDFILGLLDSLKELLYFVWNTLISIPSLIQSILFFLPSGVSITVGAVVSFLVLIAFIKFVKGVK